MLDQINPQYEPRKIFWTVGPHGAYLKLDLRYVAVGIPDASNTGMQLGMVNQSFQDPNFSTNRMLIPQPFLPQEQSNAVQTGIKF